jgi:hypothetical protein
MSTTQPDPNELLYDRERLGNELAVEVFGVRIAKSRIDKLATLGIGPPVDAVLGRRELTNRRNGIEYIKQVLSPEAKSKPSLTAMLAARRDQRRKSTTS